MQPLKMDRQDFQETSNDRLVNRLTAIAGRDLGKPDVARLAGGDLSLVDQLPLSAKQAVAALIRPGSASHAELERMVGPTIDYLSVAFLDRARAATRSVVRIVDTNRSPIGTGVMVSPRLLLTNQHVTQTAAEAIGQIAQFGYQLGVDGVPAPFTEFHLDPEAFYVSSPESERDFALIALGRKISGPGRLAEFGYAALSSADDKHAIGDFVTIIEHPEGGYMQIALRENHVIGRGMKKITLHYGADTLPGASGSPVFNDDLELIALHHAGGPMNDHQLEDGSEVPPDSNEGIRISAIAASLRDGRGAMSAAFRALLDATLDPPFRGPSLLAAPGGPELATEGAESPELTEPVIAPARAAAVVSADGWARVTVPVEIAVRTKLSPAISAADVSAVAASPVAVAERNDAPDGDYAKRGGYDSGFLRVPLPLPALPGALIAKAAHPNTNRAGDYELRYLHFSTFQNAKRRLPFFTAVNIDGALSRGINRESGEIERLEAAERWYEDPRVPGSQLGQDFYDDQPRNPLRIFDRGHMVRRLDPAWGGPEVAKEAADDTFHFTNCCPQVWQFNEQARYWAGIEDYVLENARLTDERITVFSGPVFGADDPSLLDTLIPQAFWKIVCRVQDGKLRATGFLASQSQLLTTALARAESFTGWPDLGRAAVYQKAIVELETLAGLNFGSMRKADTLTLAGGNAPERLAAPITSLADICW